MATLLIMASVLGLVSFATATVFLLYAAYGPPLVDTSSAFSAAFMFICCMFILLSLTVFIGVLATG